MGIGEEFDKVFFAILKAKQQQEAMSPLITDLGENIEDKEAILQEVHRFYRKLFKSSGNSKVTRVTKREFLKFTTQIVIATQREAI